MPALYTPHIASIIAVICAIMACLLPRALLARIERARPSRIPSAAANGSTRTATGIASVIAAIIARTASGGSIRDAFREQYGMDFATPAITPARAAATLRRHAAVDETEEDIVRIAGQLASACRLSERLGCGASRCLQTVADSYRRERRARDLRKEAFAAPKATIALLSALPVATVGLGEFMGAHPLAFLFGSAKGAVCLFIGLAWYAIGMLWIRQLFARFAAHGQTGPPLPLLLGMIATALSQGAPIPMALDAVGQAVDGRLAIVLREAGTALLRRSTWREAWVGACGAVDGNDDEACGDEAIGCAGDDDGKNDNGRIGKISRIDKNCGKNVERGDVDDLERHAMLIADCLEDAWIHGSSPMERLRLAAEECESAERSAIEQAAARLAVQLLAPTGLCFLPSFILIGIIPAIASFAA
ncbi:hypothetical protein KIH75_00885 [Bifidobacterium sp. 64T4]|uniref:hypothetical protein n=1 Tax=Bifidobacterium pongonis TaxID=2834432 RepID=UPI001C59CF41|nr:hypothetical protein [Bifidobacterium pongonis]MBW3093785.1 hypothetical protein [Bifidobacterium pongonis]MBW3093926.1 hypothetical protein [Bifidobacterium pongonis]